MGCGRRRIPSLLPQDDVAITVRGPSRSSAVGLAFGHSPTRIVCGRETGPDTCLAAYARTEAASLRLVS